MMKEKTRNWKVMGSAVTYTVYPFIAHLSVSATDWRPDGCGDKREELLIQT